jgi:hypothetical protein
MKTRKTVAIAFAAMALLFQSCSRENKSISSLTFPPTPAISTADRFALILEPYVSLRDQPGESGITVAHGRKGDIFEVTGKRIVQVDDKNVIWVNLGSGWVIAESVELYSSREKAQTASLRFQDEKK